MPKWNLEQANYWVLEENITFSAAASVVDPGGGPVGKRPIVAANFSFVAEINPGFNSGIVDKSLVLAAFWNNSRGAYN